MQDFERIKNAPIPWENLNGSTILVTGGSGYIARYLCFFLISLIKEGVNAPSRIIVLARDRKKAENHYAEWTERGLELLIQDVCDPLQIEGEVHYIVHAASQSLPKNYTKDPSGSIRPNVIGTLNLLEFARNSGCKGFLFLSSGEVYGKFEQPPKRPIEEDEFGGLDPLDLRSCYAESKRAGETFCKAWHLQFGVPTKIARLGHTYGPGMDFDDGRVFADFCGSVVRGQDIILKSSGKDIRPFCYLSDATAGLLTILLKGDAGYAYNLVNTHASISIAHLASLMSDLFPERKLKVIMSDLSTLKKESWNPGLEVSIKRIKGLGWEPQVDIMSGFKRTILSYSQLDNK
jgi:nucleoside-diphosphate-sugar epimerase